MIQAYINYPNPHVRVHGSYSCSTIQQHQKEGQRIIELTPRSISEEFLRFESGHYKFGAEQSINDMWLRVEFKDRIFEVAVVRYVQSILARRYSPFRDVVVDTHC